MKKILLGTTTLIGAAALFAGAAHAEGPKVTVGGNADFQVGILNQDLDSNKSGHAFRSDTEVTFRVDGKSDAGLGYGGGINLEADVTNDADNQGTNASATWLYMSGNWGRLEMGSNVGAQGTMKVDASSIARATGGIDGDWTYFVSSDNSGGSTPQYIATPDLYLGYGAGVLGNEEKENLNKVTYYTPRFSGFQLGVSYMANNDARGQTVSLGDNTAGDAQDIFTGGLSWEGKFDNVGIALAATGEHGDSDVSTREDLRTWNVGGKLSYMGFSVAGSYGDWGDSLRTASDLDNSHYWTVGGAYEMGAFGASVTYMDSQYSVSSTTEDQFTNLSFGVDYKLAPGLTPYAELSFVKLDAATEQADDNDATVFIAGTQLSF